MENEKHINVSKIIITVVSVLILMVIIAVLTKLLTNKKQAAEVAAEIQQTNVAKQEDAWKVTKKEETTNQTPNNIGDMENNNQIENDDSAVNSNNSKEDNNGTNAVTNSNVTESFLTENNVIASNTNENKPDNTATQTENQSTETSSPMQSENTTVQPDNNATQSNSVVTNNNNVENSTTTNQKKSNNGVIWLTFDDGPSASLTPKVLDILKKENVKATFFVINYSASNEHLIKRIVAEGHTIGIHGYSHEYSKIYKSKETFMSNIYTLQDKIYKSTGVKSMYIRFPGGSSNTVSRKYCKGIMTELTKEVLSKGFKYFDWNISSGDAGGAKNAKAVYKNVTKSLSKKRGNLVLCHDIHQKTLEALPDIIKYAKKEGYTFAKIDDNTPMYAQHVNN